MTISVSIKLYARESILKEDGFDMFSQKHFIAYIKSAPIDNQANQELIWLLSDYFNIPKSYIKIIRWHNSRNKIIEIHTL